MRLQFASDLHLETTPGQPFSDILTSSGDILILAGDICPVENPVYSSFLRWCSQNWKQVLVVAGNHEYFCEFTARTIPEVDVCIQNIVMQLPNVLFLQGGDSVVIGGFRFVGTTLWSKVDTSLWADARLLQKGDYTHTGYPPGRLTQPADIVSLHHLQKKHLEAVILTSKEPVIVITHHLPTYHLVADAHAQNPLISTYATNLEYLMIPNVRLWICGHSHTSKQWIAPSETVCILNPRGYGGSNRQFYKSALIDLSR
jgi:hypothetical protein